MHTTNAKGLTPIEILLTSNKYTSESKIQALSHILRESEEKCPRKELEDKIITFVTNIRDK